MKKRSIIAVLCILVLATSCFVGSTFAKYTSTVEGDSTGVVATWKFTDQKATDVTSNIVKTNGQNGEVVFDLFAASAIVDTVDGATDGDVDDGVIAPGTRGQFSFNVKNESQVDATYAITFNVENANNLKLVYSLTGADGSWKANIADLYDTDTNGDSTNDAVGGNIDMNGSLTQTVYWMWAYDNSDDTNETDAAINGASVTVTATVVFVQVD